MGRSVPAPLLPLFTAFTAIPGAAAEVDVSDCARLRGLSDLGVPWHPEAGGRGVSGELPDGTATTVTDQGAEDSWFELEFRGEMGGDGRGVLGDAFSYSVPGAPSQGQTGNSHVM